MNDFDKKLDFDSNTFENMKHDMNFVLQRRPKITYVAIFLITPLSRTE